MADTASKLQISELDFDTIKSNLKNLRRPSNGAWYGSNSSISGRARGKNKGKEIATACLRIIALKLQMHW